MKGLIIDCFAGGGGASVGIEMALGRPVDIAINHDPDAILIHKTNHPNTLHLTEDIFKVNLRKYVKDQRVALMWASPDCTSHSKAKGGKPRERGLRILPWAVYKHAKEILPDVILMENVEEIQQWGPLDEKGYPIPERKGEDYQKFIRSMKALGYIFDCRELVAADYGAPTTRKRWYAVFRRDGKEIRWPEPTHSRENTSLRHWEECGNYIDWSDLGTSIFNRKKPLAEATQKRIANGIKKYITDAPAPYIVKDKDALAFIIQYHGETRDGDSRGQLLTEPIKTIDTSNRYGLVTAFITKYYKSGIGQGATAYHNDFARAFWTGICVSDQILRGRMRADARPAAGNHHDKRPIRTGKCDFRHQRREIYHLRYFSADAEAGRTETDAGISEGLHH